MIQQLMNLSYLKMNGFGAKMDIMVLKCKVTETQLTITNQVKRSVLMDATLYGLLQHAEKDKDLINLNVKEMEMQVFLFLLYYINILI